MEKQVRERDMTDERVTQQQAREAFNTLGALVGPANYRAEQLALLSFIDAHPDTQGEAVAWLLRTGHGDRVALTKPDCAVDYWRPLYEQPSDSGLRRALLALAQRVRLVAKDVPQRDLASRMETVESELRELAGQGAPSVGSSGEVSP
jgi:hypothetical protein